MRVMANSSEPSSSLSFTSNGCSILSSSTSVSETATNLEVVSLSKLSFSLEQLLVVDSTYDCYSDADVVVEGVEVGVHRCILAARSVFFHDVFKNSLNSKHKEGKPKYFMKELLPYGEVGYEAFLILLSYLYAGKLKPSPMEVSSCVDNVCPHDACRPAIDFAVQMMYASSIFQVPELVSLYQVSLYASYLIKVAEFPIMFLLCV